MNSPELPQVPLFSHFYFHSFSFNLGFFHLYLDLFPFIPVPFPPLYPRNSLGIPKSQKAPNFPLFFPFFSCPNPLRKFLPPFLQAGSALKKLREDLSTKLQTQTEFREFREFREFQEHTEVQNWGITQKTTEFPPGKTIPEGILGWKRGKFPFFGGKNGKTPMGGEWENLGFSGGISELPGMILEFFSCSFAKIPGFRPKLGSGSTSWEFGGENWE